MIDIPIWALVGFIVMFFAFGIFVGYAIAAEQDLRRINRDLDQIERKAAE